MSGEDQAEEAESGLGPARRDGLEELAVPLEAVQEQLLRACNELLPEGSWRPPPERLSLEASRLWGELRSGSPRAEVAEAWSLLLSRAQAEALDRAGVPHPPDLIPVTREQLDFWGRLSGAAREGSRQGAGDLEALSAEWSGAATIAEALDLAAAVAARRGAGAAAAAAGGPVPPLVAAVLGPSAAQEYALGARALEAQLAALLGAPGGLRGRPVRILLCGPEVPSELHGAQRRCGPCTFEHWRALWHEQTARGREGPGGRGAAGTTESLPVVDVFVALNAGTSVAEYKEHWSRTLQAIAGEGGLLFFTGYTLAEAEDTRRDILAAAPRAVLLACGANRAAALPGPERVELGVTPASYPGKSSYSRCCAWLPPG